MKKWMKAALFVLLIISTGCAGSSKYMKPAELAVIVPPDKAVVYFMRPSGMGFAINFQIWDGDHFIGLSQAKSCFAYVCDPGNHLFMGFAENKVAIDAELEPAKEYFIGTNVRMGMWKARMQFTPVTRGSELWNKVDAYKANLKFVEIDKAAVSQWEVSKKAEAVSAVEFFVDGDGKAHVGTLSAEDGR